jgi:two-component system sensor histidine kinase YesM
MLYKVSIRRQIIIIYIILLIFIIFLSVGSFYYIETTIKQNTIDICNQLISKAKADFSILFEDMERIANNLSYNPSVQKLLHTETLQERLDMVQETKDVRYAMINTLNLKDSILGIYLYTDQNEPIEKIGVSINNSYYKSLMDMHMDTTMFTGVYTSFKTSLVEINRPFYIMRVPIASLNSKRTNYVIGYSYYILDTKYLSDMISSISPSPGAILLVKDQTNNIIASSDKNYVGKSYDSAIEVYKKDVTRHQGLDNLAIIKDTIDHVEWEIMVIVPNNGFINNNIRPLVTFNIIMCSLFVFILLILMIFLKLSIIRPLELLRQFMIRDAIDSDKRIVMPYTNEFGTIAFTLNKMLDNIKALNEKLSEENKLRYELTLSRQQLQLDALYNRLNPHFLYNTLEYIRGMCYYYKVPLIGETIMSLVKLLRYAVLKSDFVKLIDEINCIRNYAHIINERFGGRIRILIDCQPELEQTCIPRMILQPLVENSVMHGLENKLEGGYVKLNVSKDDQGRLLLEILDNGTGIEPDKLRLIQQYIDEDSHSDKANQVGIGISNIVKRLRLIYKNDAEIVINSKIDQGTTIVITIYNYNKQNLK